MANTWDALKQQQRAEYNRITQELQSVLASIKQERQNIAAERGVLYKEASLNALILKLEKMIANQEQKQQQFIAYTASLHKNNPSVLNIVRLKIKQINRVYVSLKKDIQNAIPDINKLRGLGQRAEQIIKNLENQSRQEEQIINSAVNVLKKNMNSTNIRTAIQEVDKVLVIDRAEGAEVNELRQISQQRQRIEQIEHNLMNQQEQLSKMEEELERQISAAAATAVTHVPKP